MSAKKNNIDMTAGNPVRAVLLFAIPMAIGSLFQALYNMTDSVIIGRYLGSEALAAVGSTATAIHFLLMLSIGLTNAFSVVMAQYYGAKNPEMVRRSTVGILYILLVSGAVIGLVGFFFARPIMAALQVDPVILDDAALYLRICVGLCFGQLAYNAVSSILRAVGDSRTPLYFLILSAVLNIGLNVLFVAVFRMGVAGVAYATVIAQFLSAGACVLYTWLRYPIFRFSRVDLRPDWALIGRTVKLGVSMSFQTLFTVGGDVIISARINSFGVITVSAYTAISQTMRFASLFFSSISQAFSVYTGQNIGAALLDRVREGFRKLYRIDLLFSAVGALAMLLFGKALIGLYLETTDPNYAAILQQAREYQIITAVCYPFLASVWMFNQTLRGAGEAGIPVVSGLAEIFSKLGGALFLSQFIGAMGLWLASPVGWLFGTIPSAVYYFSGRWTRHAQRFIRQS